MTKKIRIVKASNNGYWYADKIGEVFEVQSETERTYAVKTVHVYVDKSDAEEVIEHNSQLYRKVNRPVREGDTVLITRFDFEEVNEIRTVENLGEHEDGSFYADDDVINDTSFLDADYDEYNVIEPIEEATKPVTPQAPTYAEVSELLYEAKETKEITLQDLFIASGNDWFESVTKSLAEKDDVITHNGKQYRKVKRKAAVGELVHVFGHVQKAANGIYEVERVVRFSGEDEYIKYGGGWGTPYWNGEAYETLEPIEQSGQSETLTETDQDSVLGVIANLAQEVAELKRELREHKATIAHRGRTLEINVGELKDDIADLEDRLDENEKDTEEVIARINDLGDGAEAAAVDFNKLFENLSALVAHERKHRDRFANGSHTYEYIDGRADGLTLAINEIKEALRNG